MQGKNFVWVVSKDNIASQRAVSIGEQVGANFLINEGLEVGERVILEGIQKAREGALVNAMTGAQLAAMKSAHAGGIQAIKH
jgi:membrane fusion protein (multidrug efflux system)